MVKILSTKNSYFGGSRLMRAASSQAQLAQREREPLLVDRDRLESTLYYPTITNMRRGSGAFLMTKARMIPGR